LQKCIYVTYLGCLQVLAVSMNYEYSVTQVIPHYVWGYSHDWRFGTVMTCTCK
jgi:hypothetical protein